MKQALYRKQPLSTRRRPLGKPTSYAKGGGLAVVVPRGSRRGGAVAALPRGGVLPRRRRAATQVRPLRRFENTGKKCSEPRATRPLEIRQRPTWVEGPPSNLPTSNKLT